MKRKLGIAFGLLLITTLAFAAQSVRLLPLTTKVLQSKITVTTVATLLPTTALVGRETITIINADAATKTVYIGDSTVTTSNGFPLSSSTPSVSLDLDDSVVIYGIVGTSTADVRVLEVK